MADSNNNLIENLKRLNESIVECNSRVDNLKTKISYSSYKENITLFSSIETEPKGNKYVTVEEDLEQVKKAPDFDNPDVEVLEDKSHRSKHQTTKDTFKRIRPSLCTNSKAVCNRKNQRSVICPRVILEYAPCRPNCFTCVFACIGLLMFQLSCIIMIVSFTSSIEIVKHSNVY